MKKRVVHCIALCHDCGKEWTDYKTARKDAYNHHKKTGHYIHGEEATYFRYGEKNDPIK